MSDDNLEAKSRPHVACDLVRITNKSRHEAIVFWDTESCDGPQRQYRCKGRIRDFGLFDVSCIEKQASRQEVKADVVLDRLHLETGCPKSEIKIVAASKWRSGTEQSYRMNACGRSYVCTTAAGHTDCKPAEGPISAPASQPQSLLGREPIPALAHGGGLNKCGCHFNRKTGECHCHRPRACGCECQPDYCK